MRHLTFKAQLTHESNYDNSLYLVTKLINTWALRNTFFEKVHHFSVNLRILQVTMKKCLHSVNTQALHVIKTLMHRELEDLIKIATGKSANKALKKYAQDLEEIHEKKSHVFDDLAKQYYERC